MPASEIMPEFREKRLHSGRGKVIKKGKNKGERKAGKIVTNKKQAKAILLSYLRKEGKIPAQQNSKSSVRKKVSTKR